MGKGCLEANLESTNITYFSFFQKRRCKGSGDKNFYQNLIYLEFKNMTEAKMEGQAS